MHGMDCAVNIIFQHQSKSFLGVASAPWWRIRLVPVSYHAETVQYAVCSEWRNVARIELVDDQVLDNPMVF
jgi:hypothetical protein